MKLPNYEKRSRAIRESIAASPAVQECIRKMNEVLYSELIKSVETLKRLQEEGDEKTQYMCAKILLEMAGFGKR